VSSKRRKKKPIEGDRYYTPEWLVDLCMKYVLPVVCPQDPIDILEPTAGTGRFVRGVRAKYPKAEITAIDLMPPNDKPWPEADKSYFGDYLDFEFGPGTFDLAIGNLPFEPMLNMILNSFIHAKQSIFLLRSGFLASSERREFFEEYRPNHVFLLPNRPSFDVPPEVLADPEYDWKEGQTDSADYCFACWDRMVQTERTLLDWLPDVSLDVRQGKVPKLLLVPSASQTSCETRPQPESELLHSLL